MNTPSRLRRLATLARPAAAAFLALLLPACASTGDGSDHKQAEMRVQHVVYHVQPLDSATVLAPDKTVQTLTIDSDGNLGFPDGQALPAQGKTTQEVAALVEKTWKGAKVTTVVQFHGDRVSILGEVQRPANLPIADTPMTVMDAIAGTGGFTTLANTRRVTVLRQNADEVRIYTINVSEVMKGKNVEQNIFLESGDIISVPRSFL